MVSAKLQGPVVWTFTNAGFGDLPRSLVSRAQIPLEKPGPMAIDEQFPSPSGPMALMYLS